MIMTFFIVMFILLMQFLWRYIDDLVGKGLDFALIVELLLYASVGLIPMALPLATMLAILMTMGNMGEHNELLALKSAGISLPRILYPLTLLSIFMTIVGFLIADYLVPISTLKMRTLIYSVQQQRPDIVIRPGIFYNNIANFSLRIGSREEKSGGIMRDIMIYDHTQQIGNISVTRADSGLITVTPNRKFLIVEFYSGVRYDETDEEAPLYASSPKYASRVTHFQHERLVKRLEGFGFERSDEGLFNKTYHVMNTEQLSLASDSITQRADSLKHAQYLYLRNSQILRFQKRDSLFTTTSDTFHVYNYLAAQDSATRRRILANAIEEAQTLKNNAEEFNSDMKYEYRIRARHDIEYHRKYSMALAILIFFLIGAPLGAIIRKGGLGLPVVISVLFFIVYYVISITSEKMVRQLLISQAGMWIATFILLPIAIFLIYKATTDSVILHKDGYQGVIRSAHRVYKKVSNWFLKRRQH